MATAWLINLCTTKCTHQSESQQNPMIASLNFFSSKYPQTIHATPHTSIVAKAVLGKLRNVKHNMTKASPSGQIEATEGSFT